MFTIRKVGKLSPATVVEFNNCISHPYFLNNGRNILDAILREGRNKGVVLDFTKSSGCDLSDFMDNLGERLKLNVSDWAVVGLKGVPSHNTAATVSAAIQNLDSRRDAGW